MVQRKEESEKLAALVERIKAVDFCRLIDIDGYKARLRIDNVVVKGDLVLFDYSFLDDAKIGKATHHFIIIGKVINKSLDTVHSMVAKAIKSWIENYFPKTGFFKFRLRINAVTLHTDRQKKLMSKSFVNPRTLKT